MTEAESLAAADAAIIKLTSQRDALLRAIKECQSAFEELHMPITCGKLANLIAIIEDNP